MLKLVEPGFEIVVLNAVACVDVGVALGDDCRFVTRTGGLISEFFRALECCGPGLLQRAIGHDRTIEQTAPTA